MKNTQLAYYAGLFDGEGHVSLVEKFRNNSHYYHISIGIANTYLPVLQEIKLKFAGNISPCTSTNFICYHWSCSNKVALNFLKAILPYSRIKKNEIFVMIEFIIMKKYYQKNFWGIKGLKGAKASYPTEYHEKVKMLINKLREVRKNRQGEEILPNEDIARELSVV